MTSRQLFAVVAVQAHWRGLAGRRGAVRRRRLAELYATEDATESESSGTAEGLHPVAAPRQRSTLSRGARAALRDAEAEAAAGAEGAAAALLTSRLLAENLRFCDDLKPHLRTLALAPSSSLNLTNSIALTLTRLGEDLRRSRAARILEQQPPPSPPVLPTAYATAPARALRHLPPHVSPNPFTTAPRRGTAPPAGQLSPHEEQLSLPPSPPPRPYSAALGIPAGPTTPPAAPRAGASACATPAPAGRLLGVGEGGAPSAEEVARFQRAIAKGSEAGLLSAEEMHDAQRLLAAARAAAADEATAERTAAVAALEDDVQAMWVTMHLQRSVAAAVRLQAASRRRAAVVTLRAALCAASAIQAAGRREMAREKLQAAVVAEAKEEEKWAATRLGGREQSASGRVREQWAEVERWRSDDATLRLAEAWERHSASWLQLTTLTEAEAEELRRARTSMTLMEAAAESWRWQCATRLQATSRRRLARTLLRRRSAVVISAAARAGLGRERLRLWRRAATVLQATSRGLAARMERRRMWRDGLLRRLVRRRRALAAFRAACHAATQVQAAMRGAGARRRLQKAGRAGMALQALVRGAAVRRRLRCWRLAAGTLQAEVRAISARRQLSSGVGAAIAIETAARRQATVALLCSTKRACVAIQAGQLQAAQSKVKDLHHCVAQQEAELQQLRRSLEVRQHAEDLLKAELRMSSTMHKAMRPPILPAFAIHTSAPTSAPRLCTHTSAPASPSPHRQRESLEVAVPSLQRRRAT